MLEAKELSFGFETTRPLLTNWSATFADGEVVAITGPSGRGKSTLLYLLGLMLKPDQGHIFVDGQEVSGFNDRARASLRARNFGFVFQDAVLDPSRTVLDNILETSLYRGDSRKASLPRASELMRRFGVDLRAKAKPGEVSGGQAQRIALCRALLGQPRFLLADEPTGNLDSGSAELVVAAFREHALGGGTVVVVTHDTALVQRCDRAIAL